MNMILISLYNKEYLSSLIVCWAFKPYLLIKSLLGKNFEIISFPNNKKINHVEAAVISNFFKKLLTS